MRPVARSTLFTRLLLLSFLLAGCVFGGGDGVTLGDTTALSGNAILTCSTACSARGQCGTTTELGAVILGSSIAPSTRGHDVAEPEGTVATILEMRPEPVIYSATGEETAANYYLVTTPNQSFPAWVAGWCVAAP
jgi:hypothetical protein